MTRTWNWELPILNLTLEVLHDACLVENVPALTGGVKWLLVFGVGFNQVTQTDRACLIIFQDLLLFPRFLPLQLINSLDVLDNLV